MLKLKQKNMAQLTCKMARHKLNTKAMRSAKAAQLLEPYGEQSKAHPTQNTYWAYNNTNKLKFNPKHVIHTCST